MKRPELIILVGNIGTGKSTLTKEYVKKGYIVIARDALRYNIGAGKYIFDPQLEPAIWKTELEMFKSFIKLGVNVIIDEVGINKSIRARYIKEVKLPWYPPYKITCIEMPKLSKNELVDRRMKDPHGQPDRKIWEQVWAKFDAMYEEPTKEEGIDKIIRRTL